MNYTVSLEFTSLLMTLCLTGVVSRTVRAWILSAYHIPFAGDANDPVQSFLIG